MENRLLPLIDADGAIVTTNYVRTFMTASPDCPVARGTVPTKLGSIAQLQHALLSDQPYRFTSDELLFEVHAIRNGIDAAERAREYEAFLAKSRACLRASPLVKQFGWGLHHDEHGRVAAYGCETDAYRELSERSDLKIVAGVRSRRDR